MKERDPSNPSNQSTEFAPLAGKLNGNTVTHSAGEEETAYMSRFGVSLALTCGGASP
jgi:hypothetical protein